MPEVFTPSEVVSLNAYQEEGQMHPFTCPQDHYTMHGELFEEAVCLRATTGGWICWWPRCDYEQHWAHEFMKNWDWLLEE
jgi:hypothetical protein